MKESKHVCVYSGCVLVICVYVCLSVCCACTVEGEYMRPMSRGRHTHSFCTTICDRGQNESQRSNRNIRHSQR